MLLTLALALSQGPAPPIKVTPEKPSGKAGEVLTVTFDTAGTVVQVFPLTPGLSAIFGPDLADPKSAKLHACKAGSYDLLVYTAIDGKATAPQRVTVAFEGGKKDDDDKVPPPPPPKPDDPLLKRFKAAVENDPLQPDKVRMMLTYLAETYRTAADLAADPDVATAGQLLTAIRASVTKHLSREGLPESTLMPLRRAIADAIGEALAVDAEITPLDDATRREAARLFGRIAAALEAAK
jgi:hypothetical protein